MRLPRLFRLPKHRAFDFKPRFYDQDREAFKQLRDKKDKSETSPDDVKESFKQAFRRKAPMPQENQKQHTIRVLIIVVVLTLLFYFFFLN